MAEILQTVKEIEKFFAGLFVDYAGVNKDKVLLAYSEEGRPAFNIDKMAYFISVFPAILHSVGCSISSKRLTTRNICLKFYKKRKNMKTHP